MKLYDVNMYVYAFREDSVFHEQAKLLLESALSGNIPVGYSPLALSGFLRLVTHPRIFMPPADMGAAMEFCETIINSPVSVPVTPGTGHWSFFAHIVKVSGAKGNLVPDAWFASLCLEQGCTWVSTDRDYSRFPGLEVEYPLG
jgi:toxin-antitoxin system PIN domain toxin